MKVLIKQPTRKLQGGVGDEVECDAALGNYLSGLGIVEITQHDKPSQGDGCQLTGEPDDYEQDELLEAD